MSTTICIGANTLRYPEGGGHQWVFLNWALGFRANGCDVIWLEEYADEEPLEAVQGRIDVLKRCLQPYGFADSLAVTSKSGDAFPDGSLQGCLDLESATQAELFLNASYSMSPRIVQRFHRTALLDIDPGLLQRWLSRGEIRAAKYDLYFTIGETVGMPEALFPDAGLVWLYTPPCVALDWWRPHPPADGAPFTTVAHWYMHEWVEEDNGEVYENNKRSGFVPYFDLPRHTSQPMELALRLGPGDEAEREMLETKGWSIREASEVTSTPSDYHQYISSARGEFSGVKPSWVRLQNAWISDRTLCFLASGKPSVMQHTGPSHFLPDNAGLFRFHDFESAVQCLEVINANYDVECRHARALAEEFFDARTVTQRVLERALT